MAVSVELLVLEVVVVLEEVPVWEVVKAEEVPVVLPASEELVLAGSQVNSLDLHLNSSHKKVMWSHTVLIVV